MKLESTEIQTPQNNWVVYLVQQLILGAVAIAIVVFVLAPLMEWLGWIGAWGSPDLDL